jgi:hypothetical protein
VDVVELLLAQLAPCARDQGVLRLVVDDRVDTRRAIEVMDGVALAARERGDGRPDEPEGAIGGECAAVPFAARRSRMPRTSFTITFFVDDAFSVCAAFVVFVGAAALTLWARARSWAAAAVRVAVDVAVVASRRVEVGGPPATSAPNVCGPAIPSTCSPRCFWNALTAASVRAP